jgi:hypothetical protein
MDCQPRNDSPTTDELLPKHRRRHSTEVASGTALVCKEIPWFNSELQIYRDAPGTRQPLFRFAVQRPETPLWERLNAASGLLLSV